MSGSNRSKLITKLHSSLKKHYDAPPASPSRPLLEHALYASLLEDCPADLADEGLAKLEQDYFDWNEVRVTTVTELKGVLSRLPDPHKAAARLKGNLQAIFEEFYSFDLDHLKKENLGKAVAKFEGLPSMSPFVLSYIIQHGLGGHSIPIDYSAMVVMLVTGIASQSEASAGRVPGLERAIPKSKGIEFAHLLHQPAVALSIDPNDAKARKFLDSVVKGSSDQLDEWLSSKAAAKERVAARKAEEREIAKAEAEEAAEEARMRAEDAAAKPSGSSKKPAKKTMTAAEQAVQTAEKAARAKKAAAKKTAKKKSASTKSSPAKAVGSDSTTETATPAAKKTSSAKSTESSTKKSSSSSKSSTGKSSTGKSSTGKSTTGKSSSSKSSSSKSSSDGKAKAAKSANNGSETAGGGKKSPAKKKSGTSKSKTTASAGSTKSGTGSKKSANRKLTKRKPR